MTDEELMEIAVKSGIYWVSDDTAYMHNAEMRVFAEALFSIERARCASLVSGNYGWNAVTKEYCDNLGGMLLDVKQISNGVQYDNQG